jgi:hypothetical protein
MITRREIVSSATLVGVMALLLDIDPAPDGHTGLVRPNG